MASSIVKTICDAISKSPDTRVVLLRNPEVVMWLCGDLSFLPTTESRTQSADTLVRKTLEDTWGRNILKMRRPDLKLDKQWTNKFGEHLCEEMFILLGKQVSKPIKQNHYQPDCETEDAILEAKAQTFYTTGTAGEKILGTPFKYAEIPTLYSKPLKIVCMGGAEKICRETYGNLSGGKCTPQKQKILDTFKEIGIEYIGASEILQMICN